MPAWLTGASDDLDDLWPDHISLSDEALATVLEASAIQCEEYLASRWNPDLEVLPRNWKLAQIYQARALSESTLVGSDDQLGGFGDTVTIFPMDWKVKRLLRPEGGLTVA